MDHVTQPSAEQCAYAIVEAIREPSDDEADIILFRRLLKEYILAADFDTNLIADLVKQGDMTRIEVLTVQAYLFEQPQDQTTSLTLPNILNDLLRKSEDKLYNTFGGAERVDATVSRRVGSKQEAPPRQTEIGLYGPLPSHDAPAQPGSEGFAGDPEIIESAPPNGSEQSFARRSPNDVPPAGDDICYARLQVWHNTEGRKKNQSEWTLKIRAHRRSLPDSNISQHWVGFKSPTHRAREAARRYQAEGKLPAAWVEEFCALTTTLPASTMIGFISHDVFRTTKRVAGQSSNARVVYAGFWATLDLVDAVPAQLALYLGVGIAPLVIGKFHPATSGNKAPGWIGLYDPDNIHTTHRELAKMRKHLKDNLDQANFSPMLGIKREIADLMQMRVADHNEIVKLRETNAMLEEVVRKLCPENES